MKAQEISTIFYDKVNDAIKNGECEIYFKGKRYIISNNDDYREIIEQTDKLIEKADNYIKKKRL